MSVEDPRLSNISEENLTENFSSEIQEEIAASSTPSPIEHEIQVAQAGDGRTPTTGRVPTDPNAPAAAPAAPAAEVTPDVNNIVHLATSVSIDDIRVDGANLILVQADGTEIVIVNGATKIPTMLIGEVEVPQQVLFAALEDSGINVAAGPDGSFSASGRPDSSGAEFDDSIQGSQNGPIQLASLLGDTEFGDGGGLDDRTAADDQPDAFDMGSPFIFAESVLADDVIGNETITGTLGFDGGDDFGIVSSVNYQSTFDMAEGTGSGVAAPLTSGGQAVTVSTSADGLTVTGTIIVGETTVTVFTLTVTNPTTGAFTYTQSQPLDHPDLGEIGADDALRLNFTFTVTDKDGDSDTGSFSIEIGDDGPVASGAKVSATADEDDISNLLSSGTHPNDGTADGSTSDFSWIGVGDAATVSGSIASVVAFGADGAAAGGGFGFVTDAAAKMQALALTSKGDTLSYAMVGDALVAYVNVAGGAGIGWGDRPVFSLTLDHTTGEFTYQQYDQLDHVTGQTNALDNGTPEGLSAIDFGAVIQATDGDGDQIGLGGKFSITITDDVPEIAIFTDKTVTIDETSGLWDDNINAGSIGSLFAGVDNLGVDADLGGPIYARDDVVDISVKGGADDNVSTALTLRVDGGNGINSGLMTTDGAKIYLYLEEEVVVGRVGGANGMAAFAIAIDDDGRVSVAEYLSLKHPNNASSDEGVNLFGKISAVLTATDYDGDVVTKSVSIGDRIAFEDDGPSIDVSAGSDTNVVLKTQDGDTIGSNTDTATSSAAFGSVFSIASQSHGADGAGSVSALSYQLGLNGWNGADSGLDSNGQQINLFLIDGVVYGSTTTVLGQAVSKAVFSISVDTSGVVTLTQHGEIDHAGPGSSSSYESQVTALANNLVKLTASATITDGDGDTRTDSAIIDLGGNIQFADHGPSIDVSAGSDTNVVLKTQDGDTIGSNTDTATSSAAFGSVFSIASQSHGADGAGSVSALSYQLGLYGSNGADSGLDSNGQQINLFLIDGVVYGSTTTVLGQAVSKAVFSISVDTSGVVTLNQHARSIMLAMLLPHLMHLSLLHWPTTG
ncbi:DUF5801 repeats-in-toxin domain-containing protein [Neorhizobium sp. T7_12]|uniref:DUF5801 repeats-in-toxin domain-containing protein n=1 Tax=Neorhizobium sp. T7_12 TaxID=2093832 RepID=UPI000CF992E5|nr:DUF5801 repeats-in-toxin domain-containing protein [Neorhizobium sp. T7_12]